MPNPEKYKSVNVRVGIHDGIAKKAKEFRLPVCDFIGVACKAFLRFTPEQREEQIMLYYAEYEKWKSKRPT